jgi:hypothetical protein
LISKLSRSILQRFTQATFKDASNEDLVTQWQKKLSHAVVMRSAAVSFGKKMEELESKIDKDFEDFQDFDSYEDIEDEQFGDLSTHKKKKLKDLLDARENLKKRTTVLVANAEQNMWSIDALGFEIKKRQSEGKLDGKMLTQNVDPRGQRVVTQANIPQIIVPATQQVQQPVQPAGQTVTSGEQIIREALLRDIQRGNSQVKQFNGGFQPSPTQGAVGRGARVGTSSLSSASSSPRGNSTMDLIRFAQGS